MHIWELFDRFYFMKHGKQFSKQPSMMLSEAFAMDVGCTQQTPKQVFFILICLMCLYSPCREIFFEMVFIVYSLLGLVL